MWHFWVLAAVVYVAGVAGGLLVSDARPLERLALALLWPLGPIAFVVTVTILLAASLIVFPMFGLGVPLVAVVIWWVFL